MNINTKNKKKIYGWARHDYSKSYYNEIDLIDDFDNFFETVNKNKLTVSLRANGRSYGDNTLNSNNIILKHKNFNKIINFNKNEGTIEVQSGITLEEIIIHTVPFGWILNVCPAHRYITVAGAISNNVHGKNCFKKGYFGDYIEEFTFYSYSKGKLKCSRKNNHKYFYSIISGIGILGLILNVKINLRKIQSYNLTNNIKRIKNIEEMILQMNNLKKSSEYNIGSIDATKFSDDNLSGSLFSSNFLDDNSLEINNHKPNNIILLINYIYVLGKYFPFSNSLLNKAISIHTRGGLNPKDITQVISYSQMNFLNDIYAPKYNYYFKNGFVEYQVIFPENLALNAFIDLKKILKSNNTYSLMSSFKAYKSVDEPYIFGLSKNGYCISFDIPYEKNLNMETLIRKLNETTIKYNGQVYLAKTPSLNSDEFREMYKNFDKFIKIKTELDPENIFQSDLSKRLDLI